MYLFDHLYVHSFNFSNFIYGHPHLLLSAPDDHLRDNKTAPEQTCNTRLKQDVSVDTV